jgi:hypothetical protein
LALKNRLILQPWADKKKGVKPKRTGAVALCRAMPEGQINKEKEEI